MKFLYIVLITLNIFLFLGCDSKGGDSSDTNTTSSTANSAPVFTSSSSVSIYENTTSALTLSATDSNGDTISYSISGTDSSLFSVNSSTGVVTFITMPDYENPHDSDSNNKYSLTATATDGTDFTTQNITITVQDYYSPFQIAKLQASNAGEEDYFGRSVSVSGDYIAVGAFYEDTTAENAGSAYIFKRESDNNITQIAKLQASDAESDDYFGISVSISGDYIAVGAFYEDTTASNAGSVYIFKRVSDSNITQIAKLQASDAESGDKFGTSVSIDGDYIAVGAYGEDTNGSNAGSAYIFKRVSDSNITQIAKLQASDAEASDYFGYSLSISGDYIAVGAYNESTTASFAGSVYIFKRESDSSVTQIAKLQASDAEASDKFGTSVSIDGDYIAVGANLEDTTASNAGSVYIFKRESDSSITQIAKLQASDAEASDNFGISVSISGDYIVVGAYYESTTASDAGSVYIFRRESDSSITQIAKLQANDAEASDYFGRSVSIDGYYIAVGAEGEDTNGSNAGSIYLLNLEAADQIYIYNEKNTITITEKESATYSYTIIATTKDGATISYSLNGADTGAFNIDNNTISTVQLDYEVPSDSGADNIYNITAILSANGVDSRSFNIATTVTDSQYFQAAKIQASDAAANVYFGDDVSISGDYIAVGAYYEDTTASNAGSVYIFKRNSNSSVTQIAKLQASDAEADDYFGRSVSISDDYIAVGAYREDTTDSDAGSVYIFKRVSDNSVTQIAKLQASDAEADDNFGSSVSISGDYIAVGAYREDTTASDAGSAYIFKRVSDSNITQIVKLQASDAEADDAFGYSVSISGDYIAVGAYAEDTTASAAGSVYIFKRVSDSNVTQIAKLQASDAEASDLFGYSVSISGDYIAVGAYREDTTATDAGSVYIFKRVSDSSVTQIAKIQASDAEENDNFGSSVSISGDYIAVGAYYEDTTASNAGSAYIFKRVSDNSVTQIAKLQASDAEAGDYFGYSVSISGDYIAVGAYYEDTTALKAGSAYIFYKDTNQP